MMVDLAFVPSNDIPDLFEKNFKTNCLKTSFPGPNLIKSVVNEHKIEKEQ